MGIIRKIATNEVCPAIVGNDTICKGVIRNFLPGIMNAVTYSFLDKQYFCEHYFQICSSTKIHKVIAEDQVAELLATKPVSIQDNNYVNNLYESIKGQTGRPIIRAVHMTDPHYDRYYKEGSDINCNLDMCCRHENGYPTEESRQAKKWGARTCDLPEASIRNMLQFVKTDIQPKLFFWTGDNCAHDEWSINAIDVAYSTKKITNMILEELDGMDISYYPIQGNHDVWPVNMQDFTRSNENEIINAHAKAWEPFLDREALNQYKKYGFYSMSLKLSDGTLVGNTKVIGINTQACNTLNFFLMKNKYDPGNHLAWLEKELAKLENSGGQAIIITHLPTIKECIHGWGHRFRGILDRYQNVIRVGLYGHTHKEDIQVTRSITDNKNIGVNFFAGSLTTFKSKNPSFNVIDFDAEYMIPINIYTYYFDLELANTAGTPTWVQLHDYLSYQSKNYHNFVTYNLLS